MGNTPSSQSHPSVACPTGVVCAAPPDMHFVTIPDGDPLSCPTGTTAIGTVPYEAFALADRNKAYGMTLCAGSISRDAAGAAGAWEPLPTNEACPDGVTVKSPYRVNAGLATTGGIVQYCPIATTPS
jgi:hypothetical protein